MQYKHTFIVRAPLDKVVEFHAQAASLSAITPPPIISQIHAAPARLGEGDEMDFTMWLGPLPIRWLARIENVTDTGFTDRQLNGPFDQWVHRHTFVPVDERHTEVVDEISYALKSNLFWKMVGWGMAAN